MIELNEPKYAYRVMHKLESGRRVFGRLYDSVGPARRMRTRMMKQWPDTPVWVIQYSLTDRITEGVDD